MIVHVWAPEMFRGTGGIQAFTRVLLESLGEVRPDWRLKVLLKNDTSEENIGGTEAEIVHFGSVPERRRTLSFATGVFRAALRERPDLIVVCHANFLPVARWVGKLTGIPFLASAYGVEVWGLERGSRVARGLQSAWRVFSISRYTTERIVREAGVAADRVLSLPCTFDEERFAIGPDRSNVRGRFGIPEGARVLLTVNRLCAAETYRGYDVVLDAMPAILKECPGVHWVVAGDGDDRPRLEAEIARRSLSAFVHLAGFVPDEQLADCYRACDLFVMPSKLEGFGIVYLEAMGCGKPSLGGNADGARDALLDGELGLLANPDDPQDIARLVVAHLRGESENGLLYDGEGLRAELMRHYSRAAFRDRVRGVADLFESEGA